MAILGTGLPVVRLNTPEEPKGVGGWLTTRRKKSGSAERDRIGYYSGKHLPGQSGAGGARAYAAPSRLLTTSQLWQVYRRCADVRSAIDSIVRRVATFDWYVDVKEDPRNPEYHDARAEADRLNHWLAVPNRNGDTWQEVMTACLTDLLVYDRGVLELVTDLEGRLEEIVPLKGATIAPVIDEYGRLLFYEQNIYGDDGAMVGVDAQEVPEFRPEQIMFLRMYPNTNTPNGNPVIESLIDEVITMMRSSEHIMQAMDADQVPPGILVLTGIAGLAAREAQADLQNLAGQDHKIRVLTTPDPQGVGASWVELRHTPKDLEMKEIVASVRRLIWRSFGVMPVEMGETDGMPRATAQAQMDVAQSHLVTPMLELIQAKVNGLIMPLLCPNRELREKIIFKFDREARYTADESSRRSEMHGKYVSQGLMTRNEVRNDLGLMPISGGDIPTVDTPNGPVPFEFFTQGAGVSAPPPPEQPEPDMGPADMEQDYEEDRPGEVETDSEILSPEEEMSGYRICEHGHIHPTDPTGDLSQHNMCTHGPLHIVRSNNDMPSHWISPSVFKGRRVMNLSKLSELLVRYYSDVAPLWQEAQNEIEAAVLAAGRDDGIIDAAEAESIIATTSRAIDKLHDKWSLRAAGLYSDAAQVGIDASEKYSGQQAVTPAKERGTAYAELAMAWLADSKGPLVAIQAAVQLAVTGANERSIQARDIDPDLLEPGDAPDIKPAGVAVGDAAAAGVTTTAAMRGVGLAFSKQKPRIANWQGKLVEVANNAYKSEMLAAGTAPSGKVEWWVEWVAEGDKQTCPVCAEEGAKDMRPLSTLMREPGGDTNCGGRCRCVLVMWTKDEVDSGKAERLGPLDDTAYTDPKSEANTRDPVPVGDTLT